MLGAVRCLTSPECEIETSSLGFSRPHDVLNTYPSSVTARPCERGGAVASKTGGPEGCPSAPSGTL